MTVQQRSLRWRLTLGLVGLQIATFFLVSPISVAVLFDASSSGVIIAGNTVRTIAASVARNDEGRLALAPTEAMQALQADAPGLWFIARSDDGQELSHGPVPPFARLLMADARRIKTIDLRGDDADPALTARFQNVTTPDGDLAVIVGGGGFLSDAVASLFLGNIVVLIPTVVLVLLTLIGTPLLIRRVMRDVASLPQQMAGIDYGSRGNRLSLRGLPQEIVPVVAGMNEALHRLDEGIETTERFFMNAAHELRTPIAILQVRLDALPAGPERDALRQTTRRLAALARQLLEIERFRQVGFEKQAVDLGEVVSGAVAELAPFAVAEGYDLSLEKPDAPLWISGDRQSLDRMVMNLIQNAVQHGGGHGLIVVRLTETGAIEVEDQGPGIPRPQREPVFEPFVRLNPHGAGAGLGLKMVRDIARAHGGDAAIARTSAEGTTFQIRLPVLPAGAYPSSDRI